jgi:cell division protein FtsZ
VEAARRAISSPLLEGASINGARGVIINVTGGPDLSLMEVSAASTIVQEAADEDANIIFGAVVDPTLTGKVKITVIATGFSPLDAARPGGGAPTPVDLSPYADQARLRAEGAQAAAAAERMASAGRMSIARRSLTDLPTAATGGAPDLHVDQNADLEGNADFDVPAFLRRQEG